MSVIELGLRVKARFTPKEVVVNKGSFSLRIKEPLRVISDGEPIAVRVVNDLNDPVPVTDV